MRYGAFYYGDRTLYGEAANETQLWAVFIDWDGDGIFTVENEAARMTYLRVNRGRQNMLNSDGTGFETVDVGRLTLELDNSDGRYHPYNTGSPLYPMVRPGINIKALTRLPGSTVQYSVFNGKIDDIVPISGSFQKVRILAVDGLKWLEDQNVLLHIQGNKTIDELIGITLTEAGWPWGTDLEASTDIVPYFWSPSDYSIKQLLNELAGAYLGTFFVGADGAAKFNSRNHDFVGSIFRLDQSQLSNEIIVKSPWDVIKNNISIVCYPRAVKDYAVVVWSLFDTPPIAIGATFEVWGIFNLYGEEVPILAYQFPVANTDYKVNTLADGTGTDLTASCSVSVTVYANKVFYRITNNSASNGFITLAQLRVDPLKPNMASTNLIDAASKALYGPKSLTIDSKWLQNSNLIADLAAALKLLLKDPKYYPTIKITNRPELQYTVELFDNIDLVIDKLGISDTFRIGSIEHEWLKDNGQETQSIFILEPVNNDLTTVWQFPTQIGIDSIFTF